MCQLGAAGLLYGVPEGCSYGDHRVLAHASGAVRAVQLGRFHGYAFDFLGQVTRRGDFVVGEGWIEQMPLLVIYIPLTGGGPETLQHSADCLSADGIGVNDPSHVEDRRNFQYIVFSCAFVHLNNESMRSESPVKGR